MELAEEIRGERRHGVHIQYASEGGVSMVSEEADCVGGDGPASVYDAQSRTTGVRRESANPIGNDGLDSEEGFPRLGRRLDWVPAAEVGVNIEGLQDRVPQ